MDATASPALRDFLYLDIEKAASIYSQLMGGLLTNVETTMEDSTDQHGSAKLNLLGVFQPEIGQTSEARTGRQESRILHHNLFCTIEDALFEQGYAVDVVQSFTASEIEAGTAHPALARTCYVRAEGWSILDDYARMGFISARFNRLCAFIRRCNLPAHAGDPQIAEALSEVSAARHAASTERDGNKRPKLENAVAKAEARLDEALSRATGLDDLDDWLVEGIGGFIETFLAGRMVLTVHPFAEAPCFRVIADLKPECFADADTRNLLFAYGNRPSVRLTVFGLVTSVPLEEDARLDPMAQYDETHLKVRADMDQLAVEKAFRGMFEAIDGLESFTRYSRYPSVTVYPIAVYRRISPPSPL